MQKSGNTNSFPYSAFFFHTFFSINFLNQIPYFSKPRRNCSARIMSIFHSYAQPEGAPLARGYEEAGNDYMSYMDPSSQNQSGMLLQYRRAQPGKR